MRYLLIALLLVSLICTAQANSIVERAEYRPSSDLVLGAYVEGNGFVIASPFQLNLVYQDGIDPADIEALNDYAYPSNLNFPDCEYYFLRIDPSGYLPIGIWPGSNPQAYAADSGESWVQWTLSGWWSGKYHTIFAGDIVDGVLRVNPTVGYRTFSGDVNNVEVFGGDTIKCEVAGYSFDGDIGQGSTLGIELANRLSLDPTPASIFVKPGDTIVVDMNIANLTQMVAGCQAILGYNSDLLNAGSVTDGGGAWDTLIYESWAVAGEINTAIGVYGESSLGTQEDGKVAVITLTAKSGQEGVTQMVFLPDVSDVKDTHLADMEGNSVWPAKIDSTYIYIDGTPPIITAPADVVVSTDAGLSTASGVVLGEPTVSDDNSGVASVTNDAPAVFPLGVTVVTWTVTDNCGNTATDTQNVTVNDNEQPVVISASASPELVKDQDVIITAAGTDNCTAPASLVWEHKVGDGEWKAGLVVANADLAEGVNTLFVKAKDEAGNWSDPFTVSNTVTKDTIAPVTTADPAGGLYNADQSVVLSANEAATIYYTTNGEDPTTGSAVYSAAISITETTTLKFFAVDTAGNQESVKTEVYNIDKIAPTVVLSSAVGAYTTAAFTVTAVFSEAVFGFEYTDVTVTNGTVSDFSGSGDTYSWTVNPSADGAVTVSLAAEVAEDEAGNGNEASNEISTIYDVTAPTNVVISADPASWTNANTVTLTFSADDATAGIDHYELSVDGGAYFTAVSPYALDVSAMADGEHTVTVKAVDKAGNSATNSVTIYLDKSNPIVTIGALSGTTAPSGNFIQGDLTFTVDVDAAVSGLASLEVTVDGNVITPVGGVYTFPITSSTANGTHTIVATAVDNAGNEASDTRTFQVNKNQITGTVSMGFIGTGTRTVTFVLNGSTAVTAQVDNTGVYTLTDVADGVTAVSAKTAWTLRQKLSGLSAVDGQITANFTLLGGDLNDSNSVNINDYALLKKDWSTANAAGDIDGSGTVGVPDYNIMMANWFLVGDAL